MIGVGVVTAACYGMYLDGRITGNGPVRTVQQRQLMD